MIVIQIWLFVLVLALTFGVGYLMGEWACFNKLQSSGRIEVTAGDKHE